MTGGQDSLLLGAGDSSGGSAMVSSIRRVDTNRPSLAVIHASKEEISAHDDILQKLGKDCVWNRLGE